LPRLYGRKDGWPGPSRPPPPDKGQGPTGAADAHSGPPCSVKNARCLSGGLKSCFLFPVECLVMRGAKRAKQSDVSAAQWMLRFARNDGGDDNPNVYPAATPTLPRDFGRDRAVANSMQAPVACWPTVFERIRVPARRSWLGDRGKNRLGLKLGAGAASAPVRSLRSWELGPVEVRWYLVAASED